METELEAKFLDIDPAAVRASLRRIGGTCAMPDRLMRRRVFDYPDDRLDGTGAWVRVRDEGDAVTMSFKRQNDGTLRGTQDLTVRVDDFDRACELLTLLGLVNKSYQETRRETWRVGTVEVVIDTWPWIPPFIEVESPNEQALREVVGKLGFRMEDAVHGGVASGVYQRYYDIDTSTVNHHPDIRFSLKAPWKKASRHGS